MRRILLICSLIVCNASLAAAQSTHFISEGKQQLSDSPGGAVRGELFINTQVKVLEERGDWSRVQTEGWVRTSSLASAKKNLEAISIDGLSKLTVTKFNVEKAPEGGNSQRIKLLMTIKNNTQEKIIGWQAFLVGRDAGDAILFRVSVVQETTKVEPQATSDVVFYWTQDELPYEHLVNTSSKLKLELHQVTPLR